MLDFGQNIPKLRIFDNFEENIDFSQIFQTDFNFGEIFQKSRLW